MENINITGIHTIRRMGYSVCISLEVSSNRTTRYYLGKTPRKFHNLTMKLIGGASHPCPA